MAKFTDKYQEMFDEEIRLRNECSPVGHDLTVNKLEYERHNQRALLLIEVLEDFRTLESVNHE